MSLLNRSLSSPWVHVSTLGFALAIGLTVVGCASKSGQDTDDSSEEDESSSENDDQSTTSDDQESTSKSKGKSSSSEKSSQDTSSNTSDTESDTHDNNSSERDCDKISWATGGQIRPSVGAILPRDDQMGFVDSDGDGVAEETSTEAGMCALYKTGARCALVTYGFNG